MKPVTLTSAMIDAAWATAASSGDWTTPDKVAVAVQAAVGSARILTGYRSRTSLLDEVRRWLYAQAREGKLEHDGLAGGLAVGPQFRLIPDNAGTEK